MFSYYGSKSKIVKKYPKPKFRTIVEPFAGSARYSLEYWQNDIYISDVDPKIIGVWKYLKQANKKDILSLPNVPPSTKLSTLNNFNQLLEEEKWLIGFCSNQGSAQPKNVSGKRNGWNSSKIKISENLYKIRHWKILNESYNFLPNILATYYIDPPYQDKGKWYKYNKIDYAKLGDWCKTRKGQVIVCENEGADWMDFKFLTEIPFSNFKTENDLKRKTKEVMWYQENNLI